MARGTSIGGAVRLFSLAVTVAVAANPDANGIGDSDISTNTAVKETKALNTDEHVAVEDMPMKFSEKEEPRARRRVNKIWQDAKRKMYEPRSATTAVATKAAEVRRT